MDRISLHHTQRRLEQAEMRERELEMDQEAVRRALDRDAAVVPRGRVSEKDLYTPESISRFTARVKELETGGKVMVAAGAALTIASLASIPIIGPIGIVPCMLSGALVGKGAQYWTVAGEMKAEHPDLFAK